MYLKIKGDRNLIETSLVGGKSNLLFFFFFLFKWSCGKNLTHKYGENRYSEIILIS